MKYLIILFLFLPITFWGQKNANTLTLLRAPTDYKPNYPYNLSTNTHAIVIPTSLGTDGLIDFRVYINEFGKADSISIDWVHTHINGRFINIHKQEFSVYRYFFSLYQPYLSAYLKSEVQIKRNYSATPLKSNVIFWGVFFNDTSFHSAKILNKL